MWPENQVSIASHRCKLTCGNQGDFRFGGYVRVHFLRTCLQVTAPKVSLGREMFAD
jgi:hypothetical protein